MPTKISERPPLPGPFTARALLTRHDRSILKAIWQAGGYVTSEQAHALELCASLKSTRRRLREFEQWGFLKPIDLFRSAGAPVIYKLTARALRTIGQVNAYIRRGHTPSAVARKLVLMQFACDQRKAEKPVNLALSRDKKLKLLEEHRVSTEIMPRGPQGWPEPFGSDGSRLYIYHIDRPYKSARVQLEKLLARYYLLIATGRDDISFRIVTAQERRQRAYQKVLVWRDPMDRLDLSLLFVRLWLFDAHQEALRKWRESQRAAQRVGQTDS